MGLILKIIMCFVGSAGEVERRGKQNRGFIGFP